MRVSSTGREFEKKPAQEEQTVVTDAQTMKRKAEETVETDAQSKKRQRAVTPVPQVHVGGSGSSRSETEQRVVVPSEVPQDTRSSIEDMEMRGQRSARCKS